MKHELLVPVGNFECLIQAINNGADAVYLGGKKYGARAFSENFSLEELEQASKICHLYNVKIYVTLNTLVFEDEIKNVLEYVKFLYEIGIDALIMQDVGLISIIRDYFPLLDIHSSTQMHNHSEENISFLKTLGVKRLVFARELNIKQINDIKTDLEKEAFIHGALCISYSGQCYFSQSIMNRSANRGECAGMCRLPYELYQDDRLVKTSGKYILSPKDLCSFDKIKDLMDSNIYSFKIEGRMKSPLYVATVTRVYKKLMTDYEDGKKEKLTNEDFELLKSIYYRGFTNGNMYNDKNIMNYESCNHVGLKIGDVINVNDKKIKIKLEKDICQNEGIRFKKANIGINLNYIYDKNNKLINKGKKGEIIFLDNFFNLKENDEVYLTNPNNVLEKEITKKNKIKCFIQIKNNKKIKMIVYDKNNENLQVEVFGGIPEISKNIRSQKEDVIKNLTKTGNTPFYFENPLNDINIEMDEGVFVFVKQINEIRRLALEKLMELKQNINNKNCEENVVENIIKSVHYSNNENIKKQNIKEINKIVENHKNNDYQQNTDINLYILAKTKEQIECLLKKQNNVWQKEQNNNIIKINIIVDSKELFDEYKSKVIFKIPRDSIKYDNEYINNNLLVTSYANMYKYQNNVADYYLNITNSLAFNELEKYCKILTLSIENDIVSIKNILNHTKQKEKVAVFLYGRLELMMMKNCLIGNALYNETHKGLNDFNNDKCSKCKEGHKYILVDRNNEKYPIITNYRSHTSYILDYKKYDLIDEISELLKNGVKNFRIDFFDENEDDIIKILQKIQKMAS